MGQALSLIAGGLQVAQGFAGFHHSNEYADLVEASSELTVRRLLRHAQETGDAQVAVAAGQGRNPFRGSANDIIRQDALFAGHNVAIARFNGVLRAERARQEGTATLLTGLGSGFATILGGFQNPSVMDPVLPAQRSTGVPPRSTLGNDVAPVDLSSLADEDFSGLRSGAGFP